MKVVSSLALAACVGSKAHKVLSQGHAEDAQVTQETDAPGYIPVSCGDKCHPIQWPYSMGQCYDKANAVSSCADATDAAGGIAFSLQSCGTTGQMHCFTYSNKDPSPAECKQDVFQQPQCTYHTVDGSFYMKMELAAERFPSLADAGGMTFVGNGCCRFDGWSATNQGMRSEQACNALCLDDPSCIAADIARPNGGLFSCYTFSGSGQNFHMECGTSSSTEKCFQKQADASATVATALSAPAGYTQIGADRAGGCRDAHGGEPDGCHGAVATIEDCSKLCDEYAGCAGFDYTPNWGGDAGVNNCEIRFYGDMAPSTKPAALYGCWYDGMGGLPVTNAMGDTSGRTCFQRTAFQTPAVGWCGWPGVQPGRHYGAKCGLWDWWGSGSGCTNWRCKTFDDCKAVCAGCNSCVGFDWLPQGGGGFRCWMKSSWSHGGHYVPTNPSLASWSGYVNTRDQMCVL